MFRDDAARGLDAGAIGQVEVENRDVGSVDPHDLQGVGHRAGLGQHLDPVLREEGGQPVPEDGMVVDHHDRRRSSRAAGSGHEPAPARKGRTGTDARRHVPGPGVAGRTSNTPPSSSTRARIDGMPTPP